MNKKIIAVSSLPYVTSVGNVDRALNAIIAAAVPEKVTQEFVKTILKIPGGSGDQITAYLKKLGFSNSDGTPTELYTKFRNPTTSGESVAKAIRHAYAPLFVRNEYMYELDEKDLLGLIVEETGLAHDSNPVKLALACLKSLMRHAEFKFVTETEEESFDKADIDQQPASQIPIPSSARGGTSGQIGLNLGYTINLNLPATSDQTVFNAIFKSLKENLLKDDDA